MKRKSTLITALTAVGLCLCMTACGSKKINLNDYVEVEFKGYDSAGTASCYVDLDRLIEDHLEVFGLDDDASLLELSKVYGDLEDRLSGELDKSKQLSNGETVTFKWDSFNEDKIKEKYSVVFSHSDLKFQVSDLDIPREFDPFDYISVAYDGIAPSGNLIINKDSSNPVSGLNYRADRSDNLSNGDIVTITVEVSSDLNEYCLGKGYIPTAEKREYKVSGLTSYARTLHDIPDETKEKLRTQAEDSIRAYCAGWAEGNSLKQLEFLGYYFLAPKEGFSARPNNEIYCVYKITSDINGVTKDNTTEMQNAEEVFYTNFYYSDLIILDDGVCSVELSKGKTTDNRIYSAYGSIGSGWFSTFNNYFYYGYSDLDSMFNDCVAKKTEKYTYESTVE